MLCDCLNRERESYTHTGLRASSPVSVCRQSAGTIGSIVHLAGPCVPAPLLYLSTETGVFLLVTHSPATLTAAYTLVATDIIFTYTCIHRHKLNRLTCWLQTVILFLTVDPLLEP